MATSPSPFFFPTTAPAYVPTAVFSPPPFGYGAPTYDHFIFPSAATYPPPFSPDGYSTPSSGSPNWPPPAAYPTPAAAYPPAFPYVAASPTQVSGFSPNWQTWPPPSLGPTPSTFPSTTTSSPQNLPVASGVFFPQPAPLIPAIEMADQSLFVDMTSDGAPTGRLVMAQPRDGSSASRMQPDLEPLLKLTNADRPILTEMEPLLTAPTSEQIIPSTVPNTGIFPGSDDPFLSDPSGS